MQKQIDALRELIETQDDEQVYLRLRDVTLRLSESCSRAVEQRSDLAPVLSAAFEHAMSKLLLDGEPSDLLALEVWLQEEHKVGTEFSGSHGNFSADTLARRLAA